MEWKIFQWVGGSIDAMLDTFVSQTASNAIFGFQMLVLTCVTLYLVLMGYSISMGTVEAPARAFLKQCMKIIIIAAFCVTPEWYASTVVSAIHGLESGLADIMSSSSAQSSNIYQVLDESMNKGLNVAYDMFGKMAKREFYEIGHMFWDAVNAIMMAVGVFLIHLPAAATIIMAKLGLGILLGIGPIFIVALMFPVTAQWFDRWFQQVMTFVLDIAITMVVASVGVGLFRKLADKVLAPGVIDHPMATFVQIIALALIILFALKKTSGLGSALAGGISFGAVTFRSMGEGIGNTVNPKSTRRDLQSGQMVTAGRLNHLAAGNSMWNPAYRQHVLQNLGKHWGPAQGGSVKGG
ncbi:type IV secretion system protein VirB6 [Burkholderia pseudomallei]|nr:type IV secretion system protein VirB6 [Burkholderia pseudomallei]